MKCKLVNAMQHALDMRELVRISLEETISAYEMVLDEKTEEKNYWQQEIKKCKKALTMLGL